MNLTHHKLMVIGVTALIIFVLTGLFATLFFLNQIELSNPPPITDEFANEELELAPANDSIDTIDADLETVDLSGLDSEKDELSGLLEGL